MNPLTARKQLLVIESELNRAEMIQDLSAMGASIQIFADRAKSIGSISSIAAIIFGSFAAFRRRKAVGVVTKRSWVQTIVKGATLIPTLWMAFRPRSSQTKKP